ncbi:MAG: hypothetical protein M3Z28_00675 [Candidatus Dormibacteraeota bacterium]|nr:hypothetical protein [Candidatus Dormibacteraeota bacterium]
MYNWFLFAHIASVAGFLLAHGTSVAMAFRLRTEKTTDGIRSLTELSKETTNMMYGFTLLILITGLSLGAQGGWFGRGWIWTALILLILTIGVMSFLGRRYNAVRASVGLPVRAGRGRVTTPAPGSPEEIRRAVNAAPVGMITAIGVVALLLLLWLMILKPF